MPWLKTSDSAAHHPTVLAAMGYDVPPVQLTPLDIVNLLFGIYSRCAVQSAGYLTDYVIPRGLLINTVGPNWEIWIALATRAGYLTPCDVDGEPAWRLLDDPTNLAHIRLREEIEWEAQRKRDTANPTLVVPVRLRDGDGCRYCGRIVTWGDQRGGRGATYDHRTPGRPATGPDDLRVACRLCNARRGTDPEADQRIPPRPAPAAPLYGPKTRALLAEHGHRVPRSRATRPAPVDDVDQADSTATRPPAGHRARTTAAARAAAAPNTPSDPAADRIPQPATRPPAGHRASTTTAATTAAAPNIATPPHPAGYRARSTTPRPDAQSDPAPRDPVDSDRTPRHLGNHQDQLALVNHANPGTDGPGTSGRDGSGREATPTTPRRRPRGRRGKFRRPTDQS